MQVFPDYSDDRYKGYCIHCGAATGSKPFNNDHVPSKSLLERPFPSDLPTVEICQECNASFSGAEEYLATILECVMSGSCEPADLLSHKVARGLRTNKSLYSQMLSAREECRSDGGQIHLVWNPDHPVIARALIKNARGHYFYECGEALSQDPTVVKYQPFSRMDAADQQRFEVTAVIGAWPEVGSRLLQRVATGADMVDGWIVVQVNNYRYRILESEQAVQIVIREYLACEVSWLGHS